MKKIRVLCLLTFCFLIAQTFPAIAKDLSGPEHNLEMYQQFIKEEAAPNRVLNLQAPKVDEEKSETMLESMKNKINSTSGDAYELEPNDYAYIADRIQLNQLTHGTITNVYYDYDYYKVEVAQAGELKVAGIMGNNPKGDADYTENYYFKMALLNSSENPLVKSSITSTSTSYGQLLSYNVQPGIYYIVAYQTWVESSYYVGEPYILMATMTNGSTDIHPTSVSLNKTNTTLVVGNTEQLVATVSPSNATNNGVTWTSDNSSVATVDSSGLVTGVSRGTNVGITASTIDGNKEAICYVTVTAPVQNVDLEPFKRSGWGDKLIVTKNQGQQYTDTSFTPNDELYISYSYLNCGTSTIPYSTIQSKIYVDNNETITRTYQGTIEPNYGAYANDKSIGKLSDGTHTIKMVVDSTNAIAETNESNNEYSVTVNVGTATVHPTSVSLNKSNITLVKGATEKLVETVSPSTATNKYVTWTSSDPSIATVGPTGLVTAVSQGNNVKITVCTEDGNLCAYCDVTVTGSTTTKTVKTLSADPTSLNLWIGEIEYIALTATYTDNSTEDVTELATWTSSKPSVASVDFDGYVGEVTGLAGGSTTITARYGGKAATIKVKVQDDETSGVKDVIVQPSTVSVALGKTQAVKIYAVYDDGSKVDVTNSVALESYDDTIATVTGTLIKGVSQGETSVSGSYFDGLDSFDIDITVNVTMPVKKLAVDPASLNISVDEQSDPIVLTATFTDSSEDEVTEAATWTSSNSKVATVDVEEGIVTVTGITKGAATITGSYGGKKVTVKVKVTPLMVDLLVQPESVSVIKGKPFPVKIYAVYEDGSKEDVSKFVKLESDNEDIAKVAGTTIKGIEIGDTMVSGEYNDLPIEIYVQVTAPLKSLSADTTILDLSLDQTEYITLTAIYTDDSDQDVTGVATWVSSKPNIATLEVDTEEGTLAVTGNKKGTSTITGSYGGKKVMIKVKVTE